MVAGQHGLAMSEEDRERFIRAIVAVENLADSFKAMDARVTILERAYWRILGGSVVLVALGEFVVKSF